MSYKDRVIQHCLVDNYLMPLMERHLIFDNGACRKNKGTDFCRKRLKGFLSSSYRNRGNDFYVLRFDIHNYFESIDPEVLKSKLRKVVMEKGVLDYLFAIIDSFHIQNGKGLPLGNQTSQCFALFYLDNVDRLIKEKFRCRFYSRYMDDGIIVSDDREKLCLALKEIKLLVESLGLTLNENKTFIHSIRHGVEYLGFRYFVNERGRIISKLPNQKRNRMLRHLRRNGFRNIGFYLSYLGKRSTSNALVSPLIVLAAQG